MKKLKLLILASGLVCFAKAQNTKQIQLWEPVNESTIKQSGERVITPQKAKTFHLVSDNLKKALWAAPHENKVSLQESQCIIGQFYKLILANVFYFRFKLKFFFGIFFYTPIFIFFYPIFYSAICSFLHLFC